MNFCQSSTASKVQTSSLQNMVTSLKVSWESLCKLATRQLTSVALSNKKHQLCKQEVTVASQAVTKVTKIAVLWQKRIN